MFLATFNNLAVAAPVDSKAWFNSLETADRFLIQIALIWTGDYNGFADGAYGSRFYKSVTAFQKRNGFVASGVLSPRQVQVLKTAASGIAAASGFQILQDEVTGIKLGIPTALVNTAYSLKSGYTWKASDDSFAIETMKVSWAERSYEDLFKRFSTTTPQREVSYARDKGSFFVASGTYRGKPFYAKFDRTSDGSMGFVISWTSPRSAELEHIVIAVANSFSYGDYIDQPEPKVAAVEPPQSAGPVEPSLSSSGTGFVVDDKGHLLTNEHVVRNCKAIEVSNKGRADIVRVDATNDIALLKLRAIPSDVGIAKFRNSPVQLAEPVAVLGFPYSDILGGLNVTLGSVSSLSGVGGDVRHFQLTAPVQPGNSGGPVIDSEGHIAGMVQSRLDDLATLKKTETLPQNINFAIRYGLVTAVLDAEGVVPSVDPLRGAVDIPSAVGPAAVQAAAKFTFQVACLR